jgi:hypothetical protein
VGLSHLIVRSSSFAESSDRHQRTFLACKSTSYLHLHHSLLHNCHPTPHTGVGLRYLTVLGPICLLVSRHLTLTTHPILQGPASSSTDAKALAQRCSYLFHIHGGTNHAPLPQYPACESWPAPQRHFRFRASAIQQHVRTRWTRPTWRARPRPWGTRRQPRSRFQRQQAGESQGDGGAATGTKVVQLLEAAAW